MAGMGGSGGPAGGELLRVIVEKLNEPPFRGGLSLVTFDAKTEHELLESLNDVLAELDSAHKVDLRSEPPDHTAARMLNMLSVCKYQFPTTDMEGYRKALLGGDRGTIYPILHYLLTRLPQLKKRAYLARFLVSIEIPPEFAHEEAVQELYMHYKELQDQFKEVHKTADKMRGSKLAPGELKREIDQLEAERSQLNEKISQLKRKTAGTSGFEELLAATSALRHEQEEETKLQERMHEQQVALSHSQKRYSDCTRRLGEAKANLKEDVSAEAMLETAESETAENRTLAREHLPRTLGQRHETRESLQVKLSEPAKSEGDVRGLSGEVRAMEEEVERLTRQVADAQRAAGDDKLAMFRQQSALVAKKLQQKQALLDQLKEKSEALNRDIEDKEAKMSEMTGPKFMKREEFKKYASELRHKTNKFKKMKQELAEIRAEAVVVSRTQAILRGLDSSLGEVLEKIEAEKGIAGYSKTQERLEEASEKKSELDETKGRTLEEISKIVTDITQSLKERKNKLAPQIKELRAVRQQYQELEARYLSGKSKFENTAAGLESSRIQLEQQCAQFQDEAIAEESRYHELNALMDILKTQQQAVAEEAKFERGEGQFLREFRTKRELYTHKVGQQKQLTAELRKQQKYIRDNEGPNMAQRSMFVDLKKLLDVKMRVYQEEARRSAAADAAEAAGVLSFEGGFETGGANVMKIDD
mmetsp:Transcript_15452/g.36457  ORF Transcript_15452/g.36457 Transcript_15452/m.36457 type:complete len:703 (+) Transcript_15452:162-2270(+)